MRQVPLEPHATGTVVVADVDTRVWRVGHDPNAWGFTPWAYATEGRFDGRWDDPDGVWRSLYVAATRLGCYLEVLARFRPDPAAAATMDLIDDDPEDRLYPTVAPGVVTADWRKRRLIGSGQLTGTFFVPAEAESLAVLRRRFLTRARELGVHDLDAAAVRLAEPRSLTQEISRWAYRAVLAVEPERFDGIQFQSRHGDSETQWAVYERDRSRSGPVLAPGHTAPIDWDDYDLRTAMKIHDLTWG